MNDVIATGNYGTIYLLLFTFLMISMKHVKVNCLLKMDIFTFLFKYVLLVHMISN